MRPPLCTCTTRTNRLRDRVDLVVVHPGQAIDRLGDAQDGRQDLGREDRPVARLDHHREHVRLAEVLVEAIVHLHERMPLRQQVAGTEVELDAEREHREHERQRDHGADDEPAVGDQPGAETGPVAHRVNVFAFTWSRVVATSM